MNIQKTPSFVLLFVVMMMSIVTMLTQQLLKSVMVGSMFDRTMVARERAEILALGGVQVAIAMLSKQKEAAKPGNAQDAHEKEKEDPEKDTKVFLTKILPILNRWKIFELSEKEDGTAGTLKICISCEEGKLNLNEIYDFKKHAFKSDFEPLVAALEIDNKYQVIKFLTEFFKKRNKKLDDLSELMVIPEFAKLDVFYNPPELISKKEKELLKDGKSKPRNIALFDIFTIDSEQSLMQPLLFSSGMCAVFGLRLPEAEDTVKMKDKFKTVIDQYKKEWCRDWIKSWEFLRPIFEQKGPLAPQFAKLFTQEFEPSLFSVLSLGVVDGVEQRLLAIIKKVDKKKDDQADAHQASVSGEEQKNKVPTTEFKIIKMYWI